MNNKFLWCWGAEKREQDQHRERYYLQPLKRSVSYECLSTFLMRSKQIHEQNSIATVSIASQKPTKTNVMCFQGKFYCIRKSFDHNFRSPLQQIGIEVSLWRDLSPPSESIIQTGIALLRQRRWGLTVVVASRTTTENKNNSKSRVHT